MGDSSSVQATERGAALRCSTHSLRIDAIAPGIVRVKEYPGNEPPGSALIRYGFIRDEWPEAAADVDATDAMVAVSTELLTVRVDRGDGRITVSDAGGATLLREHEPAEAGPAPGMRLRFDLPRERRFYGLGDQTRERIEHRGTKGDLWVRNVKSYIPVPLLLTNDGVGLLVNTTRRVWFDLGATSSDWFSLEAEGATVDYYVIYGPSLKELLGRYAELTGRPPMPPKWAMGLWFICRTQADAREFMDDCRAFRDHGIPCDAISLEPGWMAKNYDFSVDKEWHPERFPIPFYAKTGRHNFFPTARRMGFKPGLWLCCDYDLSYEEERRIGESADADADEGAWSEGHEIDHNLEGAKRMDGLTRPDEPWFEHLKKFVDQGAEWFKQDGASQVLSHPDRLYGNGMRDDEMHNLNPLLYSKQMYLGFREHTGRRPFGFTVSGWAGLQRWTGTWTGDTGGEEGPLGAVLNLSLSGHGMTTCDMEVTTKEGIHFGFLLPWAQLNSWNYWRHPWLQGDELQAVFTDYARLRYRLIPYLYSAAWEAHTTGMPMLRAMPLEFPDDPESPRCLRQYLLGPSLLVGAFSHRLYLPKGEWVDYWTGERHSGPGWIEPQIPSDRGGPLFVRAGAILPVAQEMDYVGEKPDDDLTVVVFPGPASEFVLYEDDGQSFGYEDGAFRTTTIRQETGRRGLRIELSAARGSYDGVPEDRSLQIVIQGIRLPRRVELNGIELVGPGYGQAAYWIRQGDALGIVAGRRPVREAVVLDITW